MVVYNGEAGPYRASAVVAEGLGEKIRRLDGVRDVAPTMLEIVSFDEAGIYGVSLEGLPVGSFLANQFKVTTGRPLQEGDERVVVLGKIIAANLKKSVGDTLDVIDGEPFEVVGIFQSYNAVENNMVLMTLPQLQRLTGREAEVTGFSLVTESNDPRLFERLRREIRALDPKLDALSVGEFIDSAIEIRLANAMAWLTSSVALVVGAIGVLNTMLMSVFERTGEIAVLRAIGWRKGRVVRMVLTESFFLGIAGAVLGTCGALLLTELLSYHPKVEHMIPGGITLAVVLQGFVIAVLVCMLGGIYPSYRAAALLPVEGLHHE